MTRRPSRLTLLETSGQKLDIRAHQRTYQGAYIRTCLGCLSFSLIVLKLFTAQFYHIGLVFNCYGLLICGIAYLRSKNMDLYFHGPTREIECFKTSGNVVLWLTAISLGCYITLLTLISRL
ncbi:hypothetical protein KL921_003892 [Ogataea angusta]|uniref:DUF202 domain-containing protein n=1 Tax=Pichia angusta TaxID=870730 RepID=A0AAN6DDK4_PICAN|nr:uncharacterized protein KL928_004133 [Ogataea angusta]KAG7808810.1 hypothetical protein KL921_003892 [Ogataea angusta]KAG7817398.1 hypothetical protein KL928_004133 [Ogataea angusta]KAG7823715.1 hypothetical protein KL909_003112 [Ogataea angusta]KAG7828902.1 hypothetical protein KL920_003398 [Ogataea angusta]KAG7833423.1 hypothetical protein KL943_004288 [Ogataea angusta]